MKKFERKARLKAMKAAQKAARKAARESEAAPVDAAPGLPQESSAEAGPLSGSTPDKDPLEAVAIRAANKLEVAKAALDAPADAPHIISEAKAREMLASAAVLVDAVVQMTRAALADVPLPRLREAYEIVKAKPAENNAGKLPAPQRPRRGFDPVVSLVKTGLQAASLVNRIVAKLHPHLGKKAA
jgi:hypothetical protein